MKLKKILVNILVPLNSINQVNETIGITEIENDILGFHIVLSNKINKKFDCELIVDSEDEIFWSKDKKKTINKGLNIEYNVKRCKFIIEREEELEIFIWSEKSIFTLKTISTSIPETPVATEIQNIRLNDINDNQFVALFGFKKKYHFDQYRKLQILSLYDQRSPENDKFIVEMVERILKNSKSEREFESTCDNDNEYIKFYQKVFHNFLQENCGTLDAFSEYREKILKKLTILITPNQMETKIILGRNDPLHVVKKIELNEGNKPQPIIINSLLNHHEINKTYSIKTIYDDIFIIHEISRKRMFFEPQNSIILYKYNDVKFIDIEHTIEKILNNCDGESYEIILYFNQTVDMFEKLVRNYDNLFRVKIVSPKNKVVKAPNYSEIQKLIVCFNVVSCIGNIAFVVSIGSVFPKKYMNYISKDTQNDFKSDEMYILGKSMVLNRSNGKIDYYEANTNRLFNYFVECLFPAVPKYICQKINFKSPIFGGMNTFKELKNFFMKNGTINNIRIYNEIPENFTKDSLHIYEN